MASPFKVFRKHQKLWLAGLTILAMFSFVFLGTIGELLGTRPQTNPVIVQTSKYGKLTAHDIYVMRQDHNLFLQIISRIYPAQPGESPEAVFRLIQSNFGGSSDEELVMNWLKLQRAEEIGIYISDQIVNDFLQGITGGKVAARDIAAIIAQHNISDIQFFDLVREEMRAMEVSRLFEYSLQGVTPAQRWEYFCQVRKQATVELIPIEVEQFVDQVQAPNDEELKAFFEKDKDKLPDPNSPEPGFRIPHKIDVQYVKADLAKFSDPAQISDAEIQSAYQKNKAFYDRFEKESAGPAESEKKGAQKKETAPPRGKEANSPGR